MAKIDMESIKGNSHMDRALQSQTSGSRTKLEPIVRKEDVKIGNQKGKLHKAIFQEEASELKERMIYNVIIPGVKRWFLDGLSQLLFHEPYRGSYYGDRRDSFGRVQYSSYYDGGSSSFSRQDDQRRPPAYHREGIDYRNITLRNRYDAERVVRELRNRIRDRGYACVADLFDLINVPGDFSWENWGWRDERDIRITETRDGYLIDVREAGYIGR